MAKFVVRAVGLDEALAWHLDTEEAAKRAYEGCKNTPSFKFRYVVCARWKDTKFILVNEWFNQIEITEAVAG